MSSFLTIRALHEEGTPKKTIARRLGLDVRTVRKYIRRLEAGARGPERRGPGRKLDRFDPAIRAKVEQGLSAVQIHQDLSQTAGFDASYETVKRRVRQLRPHTPEVYCRMSFRPAEEAQVDFGYVGRLRVDEVLRQVWLFVVTLCFSRYAYYELVLDQTVPTFLGALRRAFECFGGVPGRTKPDNLRSAVLISQLGERYYQQDFFDFCRHYGTVPDAARPRTPTDKGRVEREIGYVDRGCFAGRHLRSFDEACEHLARWREEVALVRVHGTTRRRPVDLFAEERPHLRLLPQTPFEVATLGRYKVRKDCHVHVGGNFYSVPYRYVGRRILVRQTETTLEILADDTCVARHPRARGKGQTLTQAEHYPSTKRLSTQEIHRRRVAAVRQAGPHTVDLLGRLRAGRWVFGDQVARLHRLVQQHGAEAVDRACARALFFDAVDGASRIETILERGLHHRPLPYDTLVTATPGPDFGRHLREYDALLATGRA